MCVYSKLPREVVPIVTRINTVQALKNVYCKLVFVWSGRGKSGEAQVKRKRKEHKLLFLRLRLCLLHRVKQAFISVNQSNK